jgi:hypothetical protein
LTSLFEPAPVSVGVTIPGSVKEPWHVLRWFAAQAIDDRERGISVHREFKSLQQAIAKFKSRLMSRASQHTRALRPRRPDLLEQQGRQVAQIASPDTPVVRPVRFEVGVLDAGLLERLVEGLRSLERRVLFPAGDPEQIDQLVRFGRVGRELRDRVGLCVMPTWLNVSRCRNPKRPACPPPIEKPTIARRLRSAIVRYFLSIIGMMSSSRSRS